MSSGAHGDRGSHLRAEAAGATAGPVSPPDRSVRVGRVDRRVMVKVRYAALPIALDRQLIR